MIIALFQHLTTGGPGLSGKTRSILSGTPVLRDTHHPDSTPGLPGIFRYVKGPTHPNQIVPETKWQILKF